MAYMNGTEILFSPEINISAPTQEKTVEITENGTTEIMADEGKALSKVTAVVSVPTSTASKLPQVIDGTATELTAEDLAGATQIRDYAFYRRERLTSVAIPDSVTLIGIYAFAYCTNLTSVTIPNSILMISARAFSACSSLTSISIPDSVTSIGDGAFAICSSLISITIPNSVTSISQEMFAGCSSLTSVTIPDSVTSIGYDAFQNCSNLTSITIPDNVTSIGNRAFSGTGSATNKATITFLATTPPSITTRTFDTGRLEKIIVPTGCGEAYKTATNWANYADYIEEAAE